MRRILCTLLTICLLPMAYVCAEESVDPVVVRVGNYTYPKSLVEFMMRAAADDNGALWEALTMEEKETLRDMTIRQVIGIGVIENKLAEQGKHDFTDNEEELLRSSAQAAYDEMWTNLYQYMRNNNADISEKDVTEWLEEMGAHFIEDTQPTLIGALWYRENEYLPQDGNWGTYFVGPVKVIGEDAFLQMLGRK